MNLYLSTWRKAFDIHGRACRFEFWTFYLAYIATALAATGYITWSMVNALSAGSQPGAGAITVLALFGAWSVATVVPSITVAVRRFHDAGISAKWLVMAYLGLMLIQVVAMTMQLAGVKSLLAMAVPFIAFLAIGIAVFIVLVLPSEKGTNRWGANPAEKVRAVAELTAIEGGSEAAKHDSWAESPHQPRIDHGRHQD